MHNHKEMRKLSLFGALLFFCGSGVATAAKATETVQSLAAVQSQIPVLQATLEVAKLEKEIADVRSGKSAGGNKPASSYAPEFPQPFQSPPTMLSSLPATAPSPQASPQPRVLSISGAHGNYQATLALPNGGVLSVSNGNHVGDWVIRHIGPQGVLASHKGKAPIMLLMSGSSAPIQQQAQGGSSSDALTPAFQPSAIPPMTPMPAPPGLPSNMHGGA